MKALVYFPSFTSNIGGSEYLAFTIIQALQERYDVTLVMRELRVNPFDASLIYDVSVDWSRVSVVSLEPHGWLAKLDRHLKFITKRRLRRMGRHFDVCISCANPIDFGRNAIHFVYMLDFDRYFFVWARKGTRSARIKSVRDHFVEWRDWFAYVLAGARTPRQIFCDSKEVVLPNSNYAREIIETFYRCKVHEVFYPPTTFIPTSKAIRRIGYDVACIGRISFEKGILEIIEIVAATRTKTGKPLRLRIAGEILNNDYGNRVKAVASRHSWIVLEGMLTGEEKATYLAQCKYAIHACEIESFGISLTEYLKAGVVPLVPIRGASSETVGVSELTYRTRDEAVDLFARIVVDADYYAKKQAECLARGALYSAQEYWVRQNALLAALGV